MPASRSRARTRDLVAFSAENRRPLFRKMLQLCVTLRRPSGRSAFVPRANGVVAIDPVSIPVDAGLASGDRFFLHGAVAHVLKARVGERQPLHAVNAWDANAAEIGECLDRIGAGLEPAAEDVGILESLAGALPCVGQHGMRGVADKLNAAAAPIARQWPREQAPFRAFGHDAQ